MQDRSRLRIESEYAISQLKPRHPAAAVCYCMYMETPIDIAKQNLSQGYLVRCLRKLHLAEFAFGVRKFLYQLLLVDAVRGALVAVRYFYFVVILRRLRTMNPQTGDLRSYALSHNLEAINNSVGSFSVVRSRFLLYPLSSIRISKSLPLLSIGPRTEGEIFNLKALGFQNVRGLDLISYSPLIDLGDMHNLPYKDNQFAIVIMGWVLTYSANRRKAALEAIRVVRDGGLIAVGAASTATDDYSPPIKPPRWEPKFQEMLDCFEPYVDRLYFSHKIPPLPSSPQRDMLAIFSVKKSAHGA